MSVNVLEYGQKIANPNKRDAVNMVELAKCSSFGANPCKDSGSAFRADSINVTGFTFDGVAVTLDTPIGVDEPAALKAALEDHISKTYFNVWVNVTYVGGVLTVDHIGQGTLSSIAHSNPGNITLSRACTVVSICEMVGFLEGASGPIGDGTSTEVLANTPYNYTGVAGTDATTAGTLKTDLETALTALSVDYKSVSVTVDDVMGAFYVVIKAKKNTTILNGSNRFTEQKCEIDFE